MLSIEVIGQSRLISFLYTKRKTVFNGAMNTPQATSETRTPELPSKHVYASLSTGVLLPLVVAFLVWKRLQPDEFLDSKLFWSFLWTYPLMIIGCLLGEFIARKIWADFYSSIGDNPGQMANLFTGWMYAHLYLVLLVALFFLLRKR